MLKITKYHGLGNDFIIVKYQDVLNKDLSMLAKHVCNRQEGIGADGLIVVKETPVLEMVYYNSDGSRAKMCGNGIRCFSNFVVDEGIIKKDEFNVYTLAGNIKVKIISKAPFISKIDMGIPNFNPKSLAMDYSGDEFVMQKVSVEFKEYVLTSLLMGVPHTVLQVENLANTDMLEIGKKLTNYHLFKEGTNVNFVEIINENKIKMQTFERGALLTLACGTGACASVAAFQKTNLLSDSVEVLLPLGSLFINRNKDGSMIMSGPSQKILEGYFKRG